MQNTFLFGDDELSTLSTFTISHGPSGGIKIGGCSISNKYCFFQTKFKERDVVYIRTDAEIGNLVKTTVKLIKFRMSFNSLDFSPIYVDNLNGVFGEGDILNESEAVTIARSYFQTQASHSQSQLNGICDLSV